jgi:hypothetical protein
MDRIIFLIILFVWVSLMLAPRSRSVGFPMYKIPPPPPYPKKKKAKCICNDIKKQSPGGICDDCHSKIKVPKFPKDRIV